ncbi:PDC sensor domain-containing protein [Natronincola ferrireducens]|uniref:histidine kinase n=1 Tax=Natronincola ferrireducens TaxID=393762 RepID=A0A1G9DTZ8_9FIRM|nr:methyl-accepting chemotaxis protein [Natronincola ferrireducens]SDK67315.1 methyl-accepting chemotaxis sensory transducer with Cache sensor [Natronincola ferrireducens]
MKSIRTRIILLSCLICIGSILCTTFIGYSIVSDNIKVQTFGRLDEISRKHANDIEGWFILQTRLMEELYSELIYRNYYSGNDSLINYLDFKNKNNADIIEYYIAYPDNSFITGEGWWIPDKDYNVQEREWYVNAVENDGIFLSSPYVDANHGGIIVTLSRAIWHKEKLIGVLGADIGMEHLGNVMDQSRPMEGSYAFIADNNGNILAHPNDKFLFLPNKGMTNVDSIFINGYEEVFIGDRKLNRVLDYDGEKRFISYTKLGFSGWHIGLAIEEDAVMSPLNRIVQNAILLTLILTTISVGLTFVLGNSIAKPIKEAANYIETMAKWDITEEPKQQFKSKNDEIGTMFVSFQLIVDSLREFIEDLKTITAKVSIFSDELAIISLKTSKDIDNMAEITHSITEIKGIEAKKIEDISLLLNSLQEKIDQDILSNVIDDKGREIVFLLEEILKQYNHLKDLKDFESKETDGVYSSIEKQRLVMEEIASASQCLAELGEELNSYISRFKS